MLNINDISITHVLASLLPNPATFYAISIVKARGGRAKLDDVILEFTENAAVPNPPAVAMGNVLSLYINGIFDITSEKEVILTNGFMMRSDAPEYLACGVSRYDSCYHNGMEDSQLVATTIMAKLFIDAFDIEEIKDSIPSSFMPHKSFEDIVDDLVRLKMIDKIMGRWDVTERGAAYLATAILFVPIELLPIGDPIDFVESVAEYMANNYYKYVLSNITNIIIEDVDKEITLTNRRANCLIN